MLGTLRMDIQTCIDEYLELAPKIFPVEGLIRGTTGARSLRKQAVITTLVSVSLRYIVKS